MNITIAQAKAINMFSPATWTITRTPEGWVVHRGEATIVSTHSRKTRVFKTCDGAINRLKREVGITDFKVEA